MKKNGGFHRMPVEARGSFKAPFFAYFPEILGCEKILSKF
jgi:hypothetical protein